MGSPRVMALPEALDCAVLVQFLGGITYRELGVFLTVSLSLSVGRPAGGMTVITGMQLSRRPCWTPGRPGRPTQASPRPRGPRHSASP